MSTLFEGLDEKAIAELGVWWFQKSSETCDFRALERQFRKDLEPYYWRPCLPGSSRLPIAAPSRQQRTLTGSSPKRYFRFAGEVNGDT